MTEEIQTTTPFTVLEQLEKSVLNSNDLREYLRELTILAAGLLSSDDRTVWCAMTVLRDRKAATVASSSAKAESLDEIQYRFHEGPCLTAAQTESTVYLPRVDDPQVPKHYREAMNAQGVGSVLAVPIVLRGTASSALNLYATRPEAFSKQMITAAERLATDASKSLQLAVHTADLSDTSHNLRAAMETRTTIDVAAGIIMAQNRCTQEEAITILKNASSARNMKLRDVAAAVLTSVSNAPVTAHYDAQ